MSTSTTFPLGGSYVSSGAVRADEQQGTFTGTHPRSAVIGNFVSSDAATRRGQGRFTDSQLPAMTTRTSTIRTATGSLRVRPTA